MRLGTCVIALACVGCTSNEPQPIPAPFARYEVAKVRETRTQVEFYVLDRQSGRICVTLSQLASAGPSAEDEARCLPFPR
jgi:hypothetical protein